MKQFLFTFFLLCSSLFALSQSASDIPEFAPEVYYIVPSDGSDTIFLFTEEKAEFIGGMDSLKHFLVQNINYPPGEWVYSGTVVGQFVIEKDGSITQVEIILGIAEAPDNEVFRVLSAMPKWKPAKINGKSCRSQFVIPINFTAQ